jgi:hypothetical protein
VNITIVNAQSSRPAAAWLLVAVFVMMTALFYLQSEASNL